MQKSGTLVPGRSDLEGAGEALATTRPNAVVLEKSSYDDADINAQRVRALHHIAESLGVDIPNTLGTNATIRSKTRASHNDPKASAPGDTLGRHI